MKFIGRERELGQLNAIYQQDGFQMVVMYGRRRIGKTTLLNEFTKGKRAVFYTATRTSSMKNLVDLSQSVAAGMHMPAGFRFDSYEEAFHYLSTAIAHSSEKLVFILDEYPYLVECMDGISSILQRTIDQDWNHCNMMLIVCGSSISMMEDEVLSEKSPLYGRRTAQMDIRPFDYQTSADFVPGYCAQDKAISYGITGGIPKYLSMLNPDVSIDENIERLFFDDAGFFFEEPENLLQQEFRSVASYNNVLQTIAAGAVQISEISQKTHLDTSLVSQMLGRLIRVRIIRRDIPVPKQQNKRYIQYVLSDGMFRFWYRYVSSAIGAVERGYGRDYYLHRVKPDIHNYMGKEFETICQEYLWNHVKDYMPDLFITEVGKWRGQDNIKREPSDIDVVGIDDTEKKAVIGECKFKNEPVGRREKEVLKDRARLIYPYQVKKYLLFSLSGFKKDTLDDNADKDVQPISLDEMYQK